MAKGFILGFIVAIAAVAAGGYFFVTTGALPARQDIKPSELEEWAARTSLRATIRREALGLKCPVQPTEENLTAGLTLYEKNCQVCHGGPDGAASSIARGLAPNAPQLAKYGVEDDPEEETYWKIAHGIRFTGMPAFRETLSDGEIWQIVLFTKHMNSLPSGIQQAWVAGKASP
jgi:thiosulfate dehydrogenase